MENKDLTRNNLVYETIIQEITELYWWFQLRAKMILSNKKYRAGNKQYFV